MTRPGKVYVAPIGQTQWEKAGWTELGYTTEDAVLSIYPAEPPVILVGKVHEPKAPDLSLLGSAAQSMVASFRGVFSSELFRLLTGIRPDYLFLAPGHRRAARLRRMRSAYRLKRGGRRFR